MGAESAAARSELRRRVAACKLVLETQRKAILIADPIGANEMAADSAFSTSWKLTGHLHLRKI